MNDSHNTPRQAGLTEAEIQARVLHRDGLMLVIDKPAGLPVHRGPKGGANLEAAFDALRYGLPKAPVLAHRLDRDTSGCLVLGRHRKATATLGLLFKHGRIGKTYWAIVEGGPTEDEGTIELPLARLNEERGWWQKVDPAGLPSTTKWRVMGRSVSERTKGSAPDGRTYAFLALEPVTGRTHQLRVHCAAMGWPIVGDAVYGVEAVARRAVNAPYRPDGRERPLHLHAREIVIPISRNKEPVRVAAPVPAHMRELLKACGWAEESREAMGSSPGGSGSDHVT
jgi:tRNA pseudouridine32 synthase/23S rRNA pseudouridine746 synthase